MARPLEDRFWEKVEKTDGCWNWTASTRRGYGAFWFGGHHVGAHRVAWFLEYGEWPKQPIDHLCRNRGCVRVSHLEEVTIKENILRGEGLCAVNARKTHCKRGHPFNGKNLYVFPDGKRACHECNAMHQRNYRTRQKEKKCSAA